MSSHKFHWFSIYTELTKFPGPGSLETRNVKELGRRLPVGLDLSYVENRTLAASQMALDQAIKNKTAMEREWEATEAGSFGLTYPGFTIDVNMAEIYEFWGLPKHYNPNRKALEYSGTQTAAIKAALVRLSDKENPFLLQMVIKHPGSEPDGVESVTPIIDFWDFKDSKIIHPSMILTLDHKSYWFPKPADYFARSDETLKEMGITKPSKYYIRLLEWVMLKAWLNRNKKEIIVKPETLAYHLRMHSKYWGKKKGEALHLIETGLEMALRMGYIKDVVQFGGKNGDCFEIIPNNAVLRSEKTKQRGR